MKMLVHLILPAKSVQEFLDLARREPNSLICGSAGWGTPAYCLARRSVTVPGLGRSSALSPGRKAMETTVYVLVFAVLLGNGEVSSTQMIQGALTLEGCIAASENFHMAAARHKPDDVVGFTVECVPINFRLPVKGEKNAGVHEIEKSPAKSVGLFRFMGA